MSELVNQNEMLMRKLLFTPCESKEHLARWVKFFLDIHLPDCTVSEESNSNPLDSLWEIYDKARRNDDENFSRVMTYASRGSGKTLMASILELLLMTHLKRNVAHMAAIFSQSQQSLSYTRKFLTRDYIRDFKVGDNSRSMEICRYESKDGGEYLTEKEWDSLPPDKKSNYKGFQNYIKVIIATISGSNSSHTDFLCVDGDTCIDVPTDENSNRKRKTIKIRTLFNNADGKGSGGLIPGIKEDKEILNPGIKVYSFDFDSGQTRQLEMKSIYRTSKECLEIKTKDGKQITVSTDHPLFILGKGFIEARDIIEGDSLISKGRSRTATRIKSIAKNKKTFCQTKEFIDNQNIDVWNQVVIGSLLGDGSIHKKPTNNAYFYENHCMEQKNYSNWKKQVLSQKLRVRDVVSHSGYTGREQVGFQTGNSPLLNRYVGFKKKPNIEILKELEPLGLAVWFMDDGSSCDGKGVRFHTESFDHETQELLKNFLKEKFDINVAIYNSKDKYEYLAGDSYELEKLVKICKPFIHPNMAYKFNVNLSIKKCKFCSSDFIPRDLDSPSIVTCNHSVCRALQKKTFKQETITSITNVGIRQVYDFTLPSSHTFWGNGLLNHQCIDEVDVIPAQNRPAYEEAKHIPDSRDGVLPITLLTSTRKFSYGLVQEEIENAHKTGLNIRHWNSIDITQKCLPERHKPEEPKVDLYINDSDLSAINHADYELLDSKTKDKFYKHEAFAGCVKCPIFAACKTRLVTHQSSQSPMLKPISTMINTFKSNNIDIIQTQVLCRQPSSEGLVYSKFNREVHMLSPSDIAALIGEDINKKWDKQLLINTFIAKGCRFYSGMDFGFTHDFAVTTGAVFGNYMFILDVISMPGLELDDKIAVCEKLRPLSPTIFGDPESPSDVTTFKRKGFRMVEWDKGKGSVKAGIEIVRTKLKPAVGHPTLFFLKDDQGCEALANDITKYHFETSAAGEVSEIPSKDNDDRLDSLRYCVMNAFKNNGKVIAAFSGNDIISRNNGSEPQNNQPAYNQEFQSIINRLVDGNPDRTPEDNSLDGSGKKSGSLVFDIE